MDKAGGIHDDTGCPGDVQQMSQTHDHRQTMPGRTRRTNKIPGCRWPLGQGSGRLGIPERERRWRPNGFLANIRIDDGHPQSRRQTAPTEKGTVRAFATIDGAENEHFTPLVLYDLVGRPFPGRRNIDRRVHRPSRPLRAWRLFPLPVLNTPAYATRGPKQRSARRPRHRAGLTGRLRPVRRWYTAVLAAALRSPRRA